MLPFTLLLLTLLSSGYWHHAPSAVSQTPQQTTVQPFDSGGGMPGG
jgi:hypothetical protein